jgi:hypothetical protein
LEFLRWGVGQDNLFPLLELLLMLQILELNMIEEVDLFMLGWV